MFQIWPSPSHVLLDDASPRATGTSFGHHQWQIQGVLSLTPTQRLHGIGQGSTAAPIVWLLISSIMLISMKTWSQGVSWASPD